MTSYGYTAIDAHGVESRGTLEVLDQSEALRRIKEMGLFPTRLVESAPGNSGCPARRPMVDATSKAARHRPRLFGGARTKVGPAHLTVFTRQLATLIEAGMPLLRSLRVLHDQEEDGRLKTVIADLFSSVENGNPLSDAMAYYPKVFNRLYLNLVRAGELGGALEVTLARLADFMEKSRKILGKIKAAMFYPCTVIIVSVAVLGLLMGFIVPRFKQVFEGLMNGAPLPSFTLFIFGISESLKHHGLAIGLVAISLVVLGWLGLRTLWGRILADRLKLALPVFGSLFRKAAISRFARTLGTLLGNGVPILQALTIVGETSGNVVVARVISRLHDNVKQGDPLAPTLKSSFVFPGMVAGMVDVGEQTGALPEMLLKVANVYDDEVDNAATALTSLLEPIMILFLAVIVGGIVVAMFLPLIYLYGSGIPGTADHATE
ncbi:MAG TPA: type II secretion system F family protein [Verrucomicrobiae bacterium]